MIDEGLVDAAVRRYRRRTYRTQFARLSYGAFATTPGPLLAGIDVQSVTVRGPKVSLSATAVAALSAAAVLAVEALTLRSGS